MLPRENPGEAEFRAKVADREFEQGGERVKKWDTNVPVPLSFPISNPRNSEHEGTACSLPHGGHEIPEAATLFSHF